MLNFFTTREASTRRLGLLVVGILVSIIIINLAGLTRLESSSVRVGLSGSEAQKVKDILTQNDSLDIQEIEESTNDEGETAFYLYLDSGDVPQDTLDAFGEEELQVELSTVTEQYPITVSGVVVYLVGMHLILIISLATIFWKKLDKKGMFALVARSVLGFYVVILPITALASIFVYLGWYVSDFSIGVLSLIILLAAITQIAISYQVSNASQETEGTMNISKEFEMYFIDNQNFLLKALLLVGLLFVPFLFLYEFRIEILLVLAALVKSFGSVFSVFTLSDSLFIASSKPTKKRAKAKRK
ncbi:hypothetical protein KC717_02925 [Candidatus Dojkabacteria bacterium]|uniref:Uncharacterized protein n=1 Tax=Candidatus Dojkabacteria bacterium TaxID=2099670 RepID=A0A955L8E6_9BACT|nr:hypothetical protein [Candidatus Dojkabacteria bacterium]